MCANAVGDDGRGGSLHVTGKREKQNKSSFCFRKSQSLSHSLRMDALPEELLRLILVKFLSLSAEEDGRRTGTTSRAGTTSTTLSTVAKRFAHGCSTSRDFRAILMDTYTPQQISVAITFDELAVLTQYLSTLADPRRARPGTSSARRLFETWVGELELLGDPHVQQTTKIFSTTLDEFSAVPNALKRLHITAPEHWRSEVFECDVLEGLSGLEELTIHKFKDVHMMRQLPRSLKRLDIGYGGIFHRDVLSSHGISILDLPQHLELEHLRVSKRGTVGVVLRQLLEQTATVEVDCKYLLIGVTVEDPDGAIVSLFRNPFLEGRYVPPHVLADWDMIEASHRATDLTCSQMLEQIARAHLLRRLRVSEEAGSVKVVPVSEGDEMASLRWVSSISEHQSQLMFGLSGSEFQARRDVLLGTKLRRGAACGWLKRLEIVCPEDDSWCEFLVDEVR